MSDDELVNLLNASWFGAAWDEGAIGTIKVLRILAAKTGHNKLSKTAASLSRRCIAQAMFEPSKELTNAQAKTLKALSSGEWLSNDELVANGGNAASVHALSRAGLVEMRTLDVGMWGKWQCRIAQTRVNTNCASTQGRRD